MHLEELSNISDNLAMMADPALQQFAQMHKNDPYMVSLALSESNRRKKMRTAAQGQAGGAPQPKVVDQNIAGMAPAPVMTGSGGTLQTGYGGPVTTGMAAGGLPEDQGIAQLPTPNMQYMANGGIAGYEDDEEGMAIGGMGGMFNFAQQSEPVVRMSGGGVPGYKKGGLTEKQEFAMQYKDVAEKVGRELGVDPGILISQWGLETAWGTKTVGQYNFGNIKDVTGKGPKAYDKMEKSRDSYKSYDSPEAFAADYTALIKRNFPKAVGAGSDIGVFSAGLQSGVKGAYATDPNYRKSLASTFNSLPSIIPSAQAGESPKPAAPDLASQIPGSKVAPRDPGEKDRYITGNQGVIGAGETALQYLTGAAAIPTAGAYAKYRQAMYGDDPEKVFAEKASEVTYSPRTVGGKTVSESTAKTLEDLKVPSYLARIGSGASVRRPSAGAADVKALAKEAAAVAAEKTKTADTLRLPPPSEQGIAGLAKNAETILVDSQGNALPPSTPPAVPPVKGAARAAQEGEKLATGDRLLNLAKDKAEAAEARKTAEGWAKAQEATAKADAQNMLANERFGQTNRAQGVAALTGAVPAAITESDAATAATNAAAAAIPFKGIDENELQRMQEVNQAPTTRDDIVEAAKEATPAKERKGFNNDDLLTLGLSLLASKSPNFMTALGEAGLATVAGKKEREKTEREEAKLKGSEELQRAQAQYYGAYAGAIERGSKEKNLELEAEKMVLDNLNKWEKSMAGQMASMNDPTAKAREAERLRTSIYASLGIKPIMGSQSAAPSGGGGFKFLGVS